MDEPPSCSAWSRVVTSGGADQRRLIITSRTLYNTFEPIETERFYCEPEDDSMSDERGGYSSGTPVVAPPEEFRDREPDTSLRGSGHSPSWHGGGPLRPSSSHGSLTARDQNSTGRRQPRDDSTFITSAISHDTITDLYNVPVGADIYTLPVDTIPRPRSHHKKQLREKRRRRCSGGGLTGWESERKGTCEMEGPAAMAGGGAEEPVHMTLQEVRAFLHSLYSGTADPTTNHKHKDKRQRNSIGYLLKKALCSVFRLKGRSSRQSIGGCGCGGLALTGSGVERSKVILLEAPPPGPGLGGAPRLASRALPPLPSAPASPPPVPTLTSHPQPTHFAASLDRVKDCGWYWGPVSGEAAERILANEPDGSFIVRDSSDDHYIFSLTFRLNGTVRHVRIEHDQGNFSFGSCTKFKSQTIVDFIETAVEHSRSGRYLFFLHRRPVLGPMRVQLLHPVSRFKHIQSLQHLCRFVIVKTVRRDLIGELPLPRRLIDYLNSPHYYSEQLQAAGLEAEATGVGSNTSSAGSAPADTSHSSHLHSPVHLLSFAPPPPSHS